jgi:hypothetical protein
MMRQGLARDGRASKRVNSLDDAAAARLCGEGTQWDHPIKPILSSSF